MNRNIRRRIEAEKIKIKIKSRLKSATQVNEGGPVLSGGKVQYELAGKTTAISHGGIWAIQRLVKKIGLASTSMTTFICSGSSSGSAFCSASAVTAPSAKATVQGPR
ncbi:MAG: hypothetical protein IPK13_05275 [Deltaproteobacteria bacterium]|nr:hypothetical protein [Deltaproteobacteria bacterium]